jgi:hypothetical protein
MIAASSPSTSWSRRHHPLSDTAPTSRPQFDTNADDRVTINDYHVGQCRGTRLCRVNSVIPARAGMTLLLIIRVCGCGYSLP